MRTCLVPHNVLHSGTVPGKWLFEKKNINVLLHGIISHARTILWSVYSYVIKDTPKINHENQCFQRKFVTSWSYNVFLRSFADKLKKRERKWNRNRDITIARDHNLSDLDNRHRDKAIAIVKGQSHSKKGRACLIRARSNKKVWCSGLGSN